MAESFTTTITIRVYVCRGMRQPDYYHIPQLRKSGSDVARHIPLYSRGREKIQYSTPKPPECLGLRHRILKVETPHTKTRLAHVRDGSAIGRQENKTN